MLSKQPHGRRTSRAKPARRFSAASSCQLFKCKDLRDAAQCQFFEDQPDATMPCGKVAKLCKPPAHSGALNSYGGFFTPLSGSREARSLP